MVVVYDGGCLQEVGYIQYQFLGLIPTDAGIGDGLAKALLGDLACAVLQVTFDHEALDHAADVAVVTAGVENLLADAGLLQVLLAGVGVVGIDNDCRVLQAGRCVGIGKTD